MEQRIRELEDDLAKDKDKSKTDARAAEDAKTHHDIEASLHQTINRYRAMAIVLERIRFQVNRYTVCKET